MSDIYLTPEEIKNAELSVGKKPMEGLHELILRKQQAIANAASEKAAWAIYDFCKKYHDDRSHWFGLLEAIKKYLTEQGINRDTACNKCNSVGEYLECYANEERVFPNFEPFTNWQDAGMVLEKLRESPEKTRRAFSYHMAVIFNTTHICILSLTPAIISEAALATLDTQGDKEG